MQQDMGVSLAPPHLVVNDGNVPLVLPSSLEKRRKARGAPLFNDEDLNDVNPLTDPVAFDTLLQDESLSEDDHEMMRMKYE